MDETDFTIQSLGERTVQSPITLSNHYGDSIANYVKDEEQIIFDLEVRPGDPRRTYRREELLEKAGPRERLYFRPDEVHAAIVTCGGLCPGLNDVIRSIVRCLWHRYGVERITGIPFGYRGFLPEFNLPTIALDPVVVDDIHLKGGTILGSSRGYGDRVEDLADAIENMKLNVIFTIGGDGTQRASLALSQELRKRNHKIAVIGVPKTIDNDLSYIQKSFGFETAVSKAVEAVAGAHVEASSAINGIGLVKVMGRESGFIAAHTTLAINDVNFCLIPEVPFDLEGENGLLKRLQSRIESRGHAVVLVSEGAGQSHLQQIAEKDGSGNKILGDIGVFLKERIEEYFAGTDKPSVSLKYIDPSYMIRSTPAHPTDSIYCARLGTHAAHAAMAGKTEVLISQVNNVFVHLPTAMAVSRRNYVNPESSLWRDVLAVTRQAPQMRAAVTDD